MPDGYQSIEDLLGAQKKSPQTPGASAGVSSRSAKVEEQLQEKMHQISEQNLEQQTARAAAQHGLEYIDLEKFPVSQNALRQVPVEKAKETGTVCFYASQDQVRIGTINPGPEAQQMMEEIAQNQVAQGQLYMISQRSFDHVIELYKTLPDVKPITKDINVNAEKLKQAQESVRDLASFQQLLSQASITDLLAYIMGGALKLDTSDVHIEAEKDEVAVRFRLDGILQDAAHLPAETFKKLVSRLKLVGGLKINITDKPQDGRFTVKLPEGDVDVRLSTIPTIYGESIVMRLLVQHKERITLDKLGLRGRPYKQLLAEISRPNGMIITTGPTGSGKTTTLYAIMGMLNQSDVKIITMEDPVEYKMAGINQSQIDKSHDYTFAKGLRSMLRQDPDIAMVGEIRDLETAEIAIQAALTGHLMLSTIHTNDAFGAIPRFLSMGVKPFLLSPALNAVIGQRLVRRLCEQCKQPIQLDEDMQQKVTGLIEKLPAEEKAEVASKEQVFYGPTGCEACHEGYKGRLGIYEIFLVNDAIEKAITSGQVGESDIRDIAIENGTVTMVQDGMLKALDGMTSMEEVYRVTE